GPVRGYAGGHNRNTETRSQDDERPVPRRPRPAGRRRTDGAHPDRLLRSRVRGGGAGRLRVRVGRVPARLRLPIPGGVGTRDKGRDRVLYPVPVAVCLDPAVRVLQPPTPVVLADP